MIFWNAGVVDMGYKILCASNTILKYINNTHGFYRGNKEIMKIY